MPLARPVKVQLVDKLVSVGTVHVEGVVTAGFEVTEYPMMGEPPVSAGELHRTTAPPSDACATTPKGVPGTATGTRSTAGSDAGPLPRSLTALTVTE